MKFNRDEIIKALESKGAKLPCHRCGHQSFTVIDGFTRYHLSEDMNANVVGGQGVPAILVACSNCGTITPHAALALISPEQEEIKKGEEDGK
jgi:uncharacterized Zn finger protein